MASVREQGSPLQLGMLYDCRNDSIVPDGTLADSADDMEVEPEKMTDIFLGNKVFVLVTGNTLNVDKKFMEQLKQQKPDLQEVKNVAECDYVLVFCPIVSRAGTDIEAALKKLQDIAGSKPAVLVVLHHTFDKDYVVPDSSRAVKRKKSLTVDCLFHEDQGLLQCTKNAESLGKILSIIKPEEKTFWKRKRKGEQSSSTKISGSQKEEGASVFAAEVSKACEKNEELEDLKKEILEKKSLQLCTNNELIIATELKLVLLGGDKSNNTAVKNMIIGKEEMSNAVASTATGSQQIESTQVIAGIKVMEVDLDSPEISLEELSKTLEPQAFLLVIPAKYLEDKVISEDETQMTLDKMEIFGMRNQRYTMILFTVSDELQKKKIEEFIQSKDQRLEKVLEKCGNRFHCLNIKESGDGSQVQELLKNIEKMVEGNRNGSEKFQIISNMKERHTWIKERQIQIHNALEKCVQFDKDYENDLKSLGESDSSEPQRKMVNHARSENKIKMEIAVQMEIMFNTQLKENRQFIKASFPGNQQPIWLSLPDEETKTLEKYKKLQQLAKKFSEILGKAYIGK